MIEVVKIHYVLDDEDRKKNKNQMVVLNLSFRKLAKKLNCSVSYLCEIFKGNKYLTLSFLEQLQEQGIVIDFDIREERNLYY